MNVIENAPFFDNCSLRVCSIFKDFNASYLHVEDMYLRYGITNCIGTCIADLLYVHAFSDRADNHMLLFRTLAKQGIRVISFDLPEHGENYGPGNILASFSKMARLLGHVERATIEDVNRPLVLSGWSTGGLIVTRMLQDHKWRQLLSRNVTSLVLIAPATSSRPLIGEEGRVTLRTLTSNPDPLRGGMIRPIFQLLYPRFGSHLHYNSRNAWIEPIISKLPIIMFLGGDESDVYVNSHDLKQWADLKRKQGSNIRVVQCSNAKHELDNEIEPIGSTVRNLTTNFIKWSLASQRSEWIFYNRTECVLI
jgi:alpha-beta hydrolase superfamily lysophospholipase